MHLLISLQHADGSWDLTREFATAIGQPLAQLEAAVAGATGSRTDVRRAWATALAVAWLIEQARDMEDEWRMLAHKAARWLDAVNARPSDGGHWIDYAHHYLPGRAT